MFTSPSSSFIEQFPRSHRPEIRELQLFWKKEIYQLFTQFADIILKLYDLRFGIPVWTSAYGWTYRVGRSGVYIMKGIQIWQDGFVVDDIMVQDQESYQQLIHYVGKLYKQKKNEFLEKIAEKNRRQKQRNKKRIQREKEEFLALQEKILPDKYNIFHWPCKLDIKKLRRLYQLDANGIQDDLLVDEVGLALYFRCKLGKEDMERMERYIIRCHNCGADIVAGTDFRQCVCGCQYSFREYRRSYCRNNMPTGSAAKIFETFILEWEHAKDYSNKMILIDTLLHEFHRSMVSGTINRPVGMNFLDGTRKDVEKIINELAR